MQRKQTLIFDWFRASGFSDVRAARLVNEGEGDILFTGRSLIAGYGFRTDLAAHAQLEETFGVPVICVHLVPHASTTLTLPCAA